MLYDARLMLNVRPSVTSRGIPEDIDNSRSALYMLRPELESFKAHVDALAAAWKKDVDTVYFDKIPNAVPSSAWPAGIVMMKPDLWPQANPGNMEPAPLSIKAPPPSPPQDDTYSAPPPTAPPGGKEMTDEELARDLQARLNAGEDV